MFQVGARIEKKWRYYATGGDAESLFRLVQELLNNPDISKVSIERKLESEE